MRVFKFFFEGGGKFGSFFRQNLETAKRFVLPMFSKNLTWLAQFYFQFTYFDCTYWWSLRSARILILPFLFAIKACSIWTSTEIPTSEIPTFQLWLRRYYMGMLFEHSFTSNALQFTYFLFFKFLKQRGPVQWWSSYVRITVFFFLLTRQWEHNFFESFFERGGKINRRNKNSICVLRKKCPLIFVKVFLKGRKHQSSIIKSKKFKLCFSKKTRTIDFYKKVLC